MSAFSRFLFRLRQRVLRCYEIGLCALLVAMALALALPAAPADQEEQAIQCGNIQSSAVVITT